MKILPVIPVLLAAESANADPGHLAQALGHDHWVGGIAIGAAIAVGVWGALKGKGEPSQADGDAEDDAPEQAQEA